MTMSPVTSIDEPRINGEDSSAQDKEIAYSLIGVTQAGPRMHEDIEAYVATRHAAGAYWGGTGTYDTGEAIIGGATEIVSTNADHIIVVSLGITGEPDAAEIVDEPFPRIPLKVQNLSVTLVADSTPREFSASDEIEIDPF